MKIQYWFQSMEQPVTTRSDREKYDCIHGMTKFHTVHGVHHLYKISGRTETVRPLILLVGIDDCLYMCAVSCFMVV